MRSRRNYKRSGSSARAAPDPPPVGRPAVPDPDARHGPYHYWTRKARGKTVGLKLTEGLFTGSSRTTRTRCADLPLAGRRSDPRGSGSPDSRSLSLHAASRLTES